MSDNTMKTDVKRIVAIMAIFLTVVVGTVVFSQYMLSVAAYYNLQPVTEYGPAFQYIYTAYLVIALLIGTWIMLLLIKHNLVKIIYWFIVVLLALILLEFFAYFLPSLIDIAATIVLTVYYFKFSNEVGRDIINIIVFITVATFIGLALGFIPAVILTAIIAVYDYIAVFKTKHMIKLVKGIGTNLYISGISFIEKVKKSRVMIGGGDLVFPAILAVSTYMYYSHMATVFVIIGASAGLLYLFLFGEKGKAYPAMAYMGPAELIALGIYALISLL